MVVGVGDGTKSDTAVYGDNAPVLGTVSTGQMKALTWSLFCSSRARNEDAVVPGGSISHSLTSCRMELSLVSISYDIFHMLVPPEGGLFRGITNALVSGRMAIERCPSGESTKVYPLSHSVGSDDKSFGHPGRPCQFIVLPNSSTGADIPFD